MEVIREALESKIAGAATAMATSASGTAQTFGFIPDDIGKLGVSLGIVLSSTLIISHIRKTIIEYRKGKLEIEKLLKEIQSHDN